MADPSYKFELSKSEDQAVAEKEKERTVFVITNPSGISGVTITQTKGPWPEHVTLRLRYGKDRGFKNLEAVELRTDRILVMGNLKSSGQMRFCFLDQTRKPLVIEPGGAEPAGLLDVRVVVQEGGLEVTLPANLLRGTDKVTVSWVDAFRR